jgi:hypothetical protein
MSDGRKLGDEEDRTYLAKLRDPKVLDPVRVRTEWRAPLHVGCFYRETKVQIMGKETQSCGPRGSRR